MTAARRSPYTWVTWISGLLAGDDSCWWSAWFKSHYQHYEKIERGDFNLDTWKVAHSQMVTERVKALKAAGYSVTVEDQNFFSLRGKTGTLSGKPDIIATNDAELRIVDCKGGKRRASDRLQVLEYMFAVPLARPKACVGKRLIGEVQYKDGSVEIQADQFTPELRQSVIDAMRKVSHPEPPEHIPSARECGFCEIGPADCSQRIVTAAAEVAVSDF